VTLEVAIIRVERQGGEQAGGEHWAPPRQRHPCNSLGRVGICINTLSTLRSRAAPRSSVPFARRLQQQKPSIRITINTVNNVWVKPLDM